MKKIEIGKIVNTRGLKGEIKILNYTDDGEFFDAIDCVIVDNNELEIEYVREIGSTVVLKFVNFDTIEQAQTLKNKPIYILESELPPLPQGRYYIKDLLNCNVFDIDGKALGHITDVLSVGSNNVYEVDKKFMVPAVDEFIDCVDIENKKVIIKNYQGLK